MQDAVCVVTWPVFVGRHTHLFFKKASSPGDDAVHVRLVCECFGAIVA